MHRIPANGPASSWNSTLSCGGLAGALGGNILAVSGGDNKVSLWKENLKGQWEKVKDIEE